MTDPTEMVPWLNACFDRAEQRAQAADVKQGDPEWWVSPVRVAPGHFTVRSKMDMRPIAQVQHLDGDEDDPVILDGAAAAQHIADLDPSWRLADIGRKRKLFALHSPVTTHTYSHGLRIAAQQCDHCASLCHSRSGLACEDPDAPWPCPTVRLLVEEFDGEPGYQESWRA